MGFIAGKCNKPAHPPGHGLVLTGTPLQGLCWTNVTRSANTRPHCRHRIPFARYPIGSSLTREPSDGEHLVLFGAWLPGVEGARRRGRPLPRQDRIWLLFGPVIASRTRHPTLSVSGLPGYPHSAGNSAAPCPELDKISFGDVWVRTVRNLSPGEPPGYPCSTSPVPCSGSPLEGPAVRGRRPGNI